MQNVLGVKRYGGREHHKDKLDGEVGPEEGKKVSIAQRGFQRAAERQRRVGAKGEPFAAAQQGKAEKERRDSGQ
jgi:hypothetical protein